MTILVVATSNPNKLKEMQAYLQDCSWSLQLKPPELEIEETGSTFAENAALKATQTAEALHQWAIADDSGLVVDALNGAPGLYSARYGTTDQDRIERLLTELEKNPDRQAKFVCAVAIARPNGTVAAQVEGECPGEILQSMQGTGGFGYDPIFYVPKYQQTFAEMSAATKHHASHRGQAFAKILPQLQNLLD